MTITWVNTTSVLGGLNPSMFMAAAYESRATAIAKLFVPIASFAGDTSQTVTDGSFNSDPNSALKSSTAVLASPTNILNVPGQTNATTTPDHVSAKPLIIKVQRDPFSGEIRQYGVFNADGTNPGEDNPPPGAPLRDPYSAANARYRVNRSTGEIFLNVATGIVGVNTNSTAGADITTGAAGVNNVVGLVEFKPLEGAALSTAQQQASELSNVIQSLATLLRGLAESNRNILNIVR